jgi:hypothetical protein
LVMSTASGDDCYSREFIYRVFAIVKEAVLSPAAFNTTL